jgi:hypothetical protein
MSSKAVLPLRRRDCDSIKKKITLQYPYWSNLQFVMALLPPARPRCDDDSPWIKCSLLFSWSNRSRVASPQWENGLSVHFGDQGVYETILSWIIMKKTEPVDWIQLAQNKIEWGGGGVNSVMSSRFSTKKNAENQLTNWIPNNSKRSYFICHRVV